MKDVLLLSGIIFIVTGIGFVVWSFYTPRYLVHESYKIVSEEADPFHEESQTFDKATGTFMVKAREINMLINKRFQLLAMPITDSREREWDRVDIQLKELVRQRDSAQAEMVAAHERMKNLIHNNGN